MRDDDELKQEIENIKAAAQTIEMTDAESLLETLESSRAKRQNVCCVLDGREFYSLIDSTEYCRQQLKRYGYLPYTPKELQVIKLTAKHSELMYDLVGALEAALIFHKKRGNNVYFAVNGQKIYALIDTRDTYYQKLTGKTFSEYVEAENAGTCSKLKIQQDAPETIEQKTERWIAEGKPLIYPQRHDLWAEIADLRASREAEHENMEYALKIIQLLDICEVDEVLRLIYDMDLSIDTRLAVLPLVTTFSKKGVEFYTAQFPDRSPAEAQRLAKIAAENAKYAAEPDI